MTLSLKFTAHKYCQNLSLILFVLSNLIIASFAYLFRHEYRVDHVLMVSVSTLYLGISCALIISAARTKRQRKISWYVTLATLIASVFTYFLFGFYSVFSWIVTMINFR